jgi:3-hydroxyisobutyrate dehydrogenase-like beta-hydroxyacid dehydrogenase
MSNPVSAGVLGLGIIGSIWARHLDAAGFLRASWNRTARPEFPRWTDSPAAAADVCDAMIVVVADPPAVESVLKAMLPRLAPRHVVIQSSTIDPVSSGRFEALVRDRGAHYIEAPFTGSRPAAEARKTVFYLGGADEALARAEPVLAQVSDTMLRIGTGAQAATLKLACNLQLSAQLEALCESLHWARKAGIPDGTFFDALRRNAAWSGLIALKEPKLRAADYSPQFSIKHMLKDMRLALGSSPAPLPLVETVAARLQAAADGGWAEEDMCALYKTRKSTADSR